MATQDRRPRFYEGQYLAADDLDAIVEYLRAGDARHALAGHTWGIALGLDLVEKNAPGPPDRKEVVLQPGFAWDGFGRPLVVMQPERLSESLLEGIAYNAAIDDPALPGGPVGRLVKVWLNYREIKAQPPAPGFETCATDDQNARVRETFELVAGEFPETSLQRANVAIGPESVEASRALRQFDAAAPRLWDTSVPHQTFPSAARPPRWLVPVGYVRWVAGDGVPGYFLRRDKVASDNVLDAIRGFRRHVGVVAETMEAPAGVILLRRRGDQPDAPHRFRRLLSSHGAAALLTDLVWVEGNLRVEGDAKLAGGKLLLRDADGLDQNTPLYLARHGDDSPGGTAGQRELRVAIGGHAQRDNRLVVGPDRVTAGVTEILPNLVVVSGRPAPLTGGVVGVNVAAPERSLHVRGDRVRLESNDMAKRLDLRADGSAVDMHSETSKLFIHASGPAASGQNHVVFNTQKPAEGNVGIGTASPAHGLDVKARSINLGLDEDGGGRALLRHDAANQVLVEATNSGGAGPATELRLGGPAGANLPLLAGYADTTYLKGRLGVNVATPAVQLHVRGPRVRVESTDSLRVLELRTDGSHVDVETRTGHLYLRSAVAAGAANNNIVMNPDALDGSVAIGTHVPVAKLHVAGSAVVTGNVGIGTVTPQEQLHVAGNFVRVDGAANQQAYIGADAVGTDIQVGSFNAGIPSVHFWNAGYSSWMDLRSRDIRCRELFWEDETHVSDLRLKTAIEPMTGVLDRVCRLRGVSFEWRPPAATPESEERGRKDAAPRARRRQLGLIAQEVREVFPEIVRKVDDEDLGISMTALFPLLLESIKELKAQVDDLRAQVKDLSGKSEKQDKQKKG